MVLIDFLNHILDFQDSQRIIELIYTDTEIPSSDALGRNFTVDIICQTEDNRYFLLEMQNDYSPDYTDKVFFEFGRYLGGIDAEKLSDISTDDRKRRRIGEKDVEAKDFWQKVEKVFFLVISNKRFEIGKMKSFFSDEEISEPDVINTYEMLNTTRPARHLGNLKAKVILIMLANFQKEADELETVTDRWLFALKDERMSTGKKKNDPFKPVSDIATAASGSIALKQFYAELLPRNIRNNLLIRFEAEIAERNASLDRLCVEWKQKGLEEGLRRITEIAKVLKNQGIMDILNIAVVTGLSADVIASL